MTPNSMIKMFLKNANQLRFRNLFFIVITLFFVDLLIPDFIPLIDEIILGLLAIILANWKKERKQDKDSKVIKTSVYGVRVAKEALGSIFPGPRVVEATYRVVTTVPRAVRFISRFRRPPASNTK